MDPRIPALAARVRRDPTMDNRAALADALNEILRGDDDGDFDAYSVLDLVHSL